MLGIKSKQTRAPRYLYRPYHLLHVAHHSTSNTKHLSTSRHSSWPLARQWGKHERHQIPTNTSNLYIATTRSPVNNLATALSSSQCDSYYQHPYPTRLEDDWTAWTASIMRKEKTYIPDHLQHQSPILTGLQYPSQVVSTITGLYRE